MYRDCACAVIIFVTPVQSSPVQSKSPVKFRSLVKTDFCRVIFSRMLLSHLQCMLIASVDFCGR